ncbi:hypothetical protein CMALT430_70054 [Carnobacterium maltaromaticum]|nr:hypothetical protein CMALT430_70054 [Carnobacterium maltaromaticum]
MRIPPLIVIGMFILPNKFENNSTLLYFVVVNLQFTLVR